MCYSSVHSLAAANVDIPPSPQVTPDHPLETPGPIDPLLDDSASLIIKKEKMSKAGAKCKMRPSPTKNGRYVDSLRSRHAHHVSDYQTSNLCAHRWLKQMNTSGSTDEFCIYYNSLGQGQRKVCDIDPFIRSACIHWSNTGVWWWSKQTRESDGRHHLRSINWWFLDCWRELGQDRHCCRQDVLEPSCGYHDAFDSHPFHCMLLLIACFPFFIAYPRVIIPEHVFSYTSIIISRPEWAHSTR